MVLSDEAVAAVRALGPKAVPTLLNWLRSSDSSVSRKANIVLERGLKLPVRVPTNEDKRMRAMYGFRALGPAARSAFSALVAIALNSPDEWQRGDAINALTESDAETMRLLAGGLKSPDREVRLRAAFALACIRIAPDAVCLPALEGALNDPDTGVRGEAAKGIALFHQQLKACADRLDHRDAEVRASAARVVGGYRSRARAFLPALEAAVRDSDPEVCDAIAEAIQQVRGRGSP
ncbi:HEAT repeat domain-containing protein [Planctomyces sp. SH-PL62]|uniref:HEAT repeat domain-containing protein n=1 Tax=Planctomyces sp. SH-PL62 TaxID=1636152 RepID=UPI0018D39E1F|nr:HEAT repeat domain-containing protein [Planctomyces sp. SH-PL62]